MITTKPYSGKKWQATGWIYSADPRFPCGEYLEEMISCSWIGSVPEEDASVEQIVQVLIEDHPYLDLGWLRRIVPHLRDKETV